LRKACPTLKATTSFNIVANGAPELSWCDSSAAAVSRAVAAPVRYVHPCHDGIHLGLTLWDDLGSLPQARVFGRDRGEVGQGGISVRKIFLIVAKPYFGFATSGCAG
jgi:hypothetical protein